MAKSEKRKLLLILIATGILILSVARVWWAQSSGEDRPSRSVSTSSSPAPSVASKTRAKTQPRVENLIVLSRSASAEVQADLLLSIASSKLITDKKRRIELLNEAFQLASRVSEPVRKKASGRLVDTRAGFEQRAFDLQLDRLSIESRAISALIPLDPTGARTMFQSVVLPKLQPLDCQDSLVPDFTAYYATIVAIAQNCFTPEEKKAQAHVQFMSDQIESIKSISQATAVLKAVAGAKLSDEELSRVVLSLAKAFGQASADPRSFAFVVQRDGLISETEKFLSTMKKRDIPVDGLSTRVRELLVRNMTSEVCADAGWVNQKAALPPEIDVINVHFKSPITTDDIGRLRLGSKSADVEFWTTPKASALLQGAKGLRFGADGHRLSVEERNTEEWHDKLVAFLDQLDHWDSASEDSEDDYFQQRCNMYRVLIDLCPDDLQRDAVLRAYGVYLKDSNRRYKGRIEWISPVKDYLKTLQSKQQTTFQSSLDPWLSSSDNTLRVYAELSLLLRDL